MIDTYWSTSYSIREMLRTLFRSEAFYSDASYRARIKNPTEYVAGAFRALGIEPSDKSSRRGPNLISVMGQRLLDPPDPSGWDEGPSWISTGNLLQRVNMGASLVQTSDFDATAVVLTATGNDATKIVDTLLGLLVDGAVNATTRSLLISETSAAPATQRKKRALQLLIGLPEFQFA